MTKAPTTTRKRSTTTVRKAPAAARSSAAATSRPDPNPTETAIIDAPIPAPQIDGNELRKNDLVDMVVETSGMKKKDVKPAVEAMLAVLGQVLSDGRTLSLQPLGKVMVTNKKDKDNGEVLTLRLRRSRQSAEQAADEVKTPLAEPCEDG
ncbi:DNA-binding protein HU-alpha [Rhodovulum bhavnagarense]|uniref:DNA-binding protein HU-alpha n=1 Tax=Rhodovulum bhavnagarense TaxID=992286 RepID=A0A4R2RED0_9RHOB|nr:HU family DNA-binding protein [Rhodovulum bhavnagarense]TCP61852.1 DNA-binding protein HU-alpha [Rhodovulum bhavnagarense]